MLAGRRSASVCGVVIVMAAWVAVLVDAEDNRAAAAARDYLGEAPKAAEAKGKADYSKHPKVPNYMTVERKLVTGSWVRCKLACDGDPACSGFKFTPMVKDNLPLCEILTTAGGSYLKPRVGGNNTMRNASATFTNTSQDSSKEDSLEQVPGKELIMKKYQKAKELVRKSEDTHERTQEYAKDMNARLLAIKKEVHAGKDQIHAMQEREAASKKRVVAAHATVKKAKIEVEKLERQEQTRSNREAQEIKAKATKDAAETKGEAKKDIAHSEKEAMNSISKRAEHVGREETSIKAAVTDVSAKEVLVKHLCKKNMMVLKLKKKVLQAELELKYKDVPADLLKAKAKVERQLKAEKDKLKASEQVSKKYGSKETQEKKRVSADQRKAKKLSEAMDGADLVNQGELAELETEAREYKLDHKALGVDEKKLTQYRKRMRELEVKKDEATKKADASFWHEKKTKKSMKEKLEKEKFKALAGAAESKKMLLMLHKTLTERRKSLEKDIIRLRTMAKLNEESKGELWAEWKKLGIEEEHLKHEIERLKSIKYQTQMLHEAYVRRIKQIKAFGGAVWLKKHNIRTAIAKFRSDVIALGTYTDRMTKTSDEETESNIVQNMFDMDQRRQEVIDDISKQSADAAHSVIEEQLRIDKGVIKKVKSPGEMVKLFEKLRQKKQNLKKEVAALKAQAPTFDDIVAGEFHAVSTYTDRAAVVRMMTRLNAQLKRAMNSTAIEKRKSVLQTAKAAARLYAHQVAHASHEQYLDFKLGRLDHKVSSVKNEIRQLKAKAGIPSTAAPPENYDELLDDQKKEKTGASAQEFTVTGNSWLNPEPVARPVEVSESMRKNFRSALKAEFAEIAQGGSKNQGEMEDLRELSV